MHDALCIRLVQVNPNLTVPWFIMASYAYYVEHRPIISDATFDWLVSMLRWGWSHLVHQHKHLITEDDLAAGTGYALKWPPGIEHKVAAVRAAHTEMR